MRYFINLEKTSVSLRALDIAGQCQGRGNLFFLWLCLVLIFGFSPTALAADKKINIQGKLTNKDGKPITGATHTLHFKLYDAATLGTPLGQEDQGVDLGNDGLFNVRLGESGALDPLAFDKQLYLGIAIDAEQIELAPRQTLSASPYALGSIGDFNVGKKLVVGDNARFSAVSEAWSEGIRIDVARNAWGGIRWYRGDANYNGNWALGYKNDSSDDLIFTNNNGGIQYDRLALTKSGNVGIGTTGPNARLDLGSGYGSSGAKFLMYNDNTSGELAGTKAGFYMDNFTANNLNLVFPEHSVNPGLFTISAKATNGTTLKPYFAVKGLTGNVGIGTTSPSSNLTILGSSSQLGYGMLRAIGNGTNYEAGIGYRDTSDTDATSWVAGKNIGLTSDAFSWYYGGVKMVLTTDGNVGIGTTSPVTKLHISAGDNSLTLFGPNSSWGGYLLVGAGRNDITTGRAQVISTNGNLHLDSASTSDTYINYYSGRNTYINTLGGNVGIGTASPQAKLDVAGDVRVSGKINSEQGKPAFFVTVVEDMCNWPHPQPLGCPTGYILAGKWHVGRGAGGCDNDSRGEGYENGQISGGWMGLCVAQ